MSFYDKKMLELIKKSKYVLIPIEEYLKFKELKDERERQNKHSKASCKVCKV